MQQPCYTNPKNDADYHARMLNYILSTQSDLALEVVNGKVKVVRTKK